MSTQLISIVMPVKNAGLYLKACLQSIINQTENNWELLAVNDHSTDDSAFILEEFSNIDIRIQWFENAGSGIIPALQTAYSKSKGNLIHRMDADDLMPAEKLANLKKLLLTKGKGYLATGKVKYFAKGGVNDGYINYQNWLNQLCEDETHWQEIFKECVIASPNWLVHRKDFDRCGAFNSAIYPEDYDLVFRFFKEGLKVTCLKEVTHLWRDHAERSSRNHIHYAHNTFFEIKIYYFLLLSYQAERPLMVWGAGKKGKLMAKLLQKQSIAFSWVSNNPNKHGKEIYDQLMESFETIALKDNPQIVITVALRNAKSEIIEFLTNLNLKEGKDFFFFS